MTIEKIPVVVKVTDAAGFMRAKIEDEQYARLLSDIRRIVREELQLQTLKDGEA